jgi:hypothetical protein
VYKGFEMGERFLESLPNLSTISQETLTGSFASFLAIIFDFFFKYKKSG